MRVLAVVVAVLLPSLAAAQVPQKLGYQGRLLKADGTPESGVIKMTFALFSTATGGTAAWTEDQNVPLSDGFYSLYLGDVTPLPANVFDGSEKFLELTTNSTPLTPRQRVASVPYAIACQNVS